MPLNSFPATVSEETLKLKIEAAEGRIFVDVGFWGGLVPENAFNASALEGLLKAGVLGLKSFMCPSGINDFPMTNTTHIKEGLSVLAKYRRPLLVHAEVQQDHEGYLELKDGVDDARYYSTYLQTRPASMEQAAIRELLTLSKDTRTGGPAEGAHLHVVHLSDSGAYLDLIKLKRFKMGTRILSVLHLSVMHQFVLPVTWSYGRKYGITFKQLTSWWSEKPAKLAGLGLKGAIAVGNHADIVVWEPEVEFDLNDNHPIYLKHPSISAYLGSKLSGKVLGAFVRGNLVFEDGKHALSACGAQILAR